MKFWFQLYILSTYHRIIISGVIEKLCITKIVYAGYQDNRLLDMLEMMEIYFF